RRARGGDSKGVRGAGRGAARADGQPGGVGDRGEEGLNFAWASPMRAAAIDRYGSPSVLKVRDLPMPKVGAQEVLIAIDTAGVGIWDAKTRSGKWAEGGDDQFPCILGVDGAGTVIAAGARVRRIRPGNRVYAYSYDNPKGGFYAEYVAVAASKVAPIPEGLDMKNAGAIPVIALTALQGVDDALQLQRNESVIIHGASGNVGMMAVQFA